MQTQQKSALRRLEEILEMETMRVRVTIVFDPGKNKLRATAQNVWVRFPNALRVKGAVYECEVKRGKADSFMALGGLDDIIPVNDIAKAAHRAA